MIKVTKEVISAVLPKIHLVEINQIGRQTELVPVSSLDKEQCHLVQSLTTRTLAHACFDGNQWRFNDGHTECSAEAFFTGEKICLVNEIDLEALKWTWENCKSRTDSPQ